MPLEFETDKWPFVPAKSSHEVPGKRKVRLIVIHSMEAPEKGDTAEEIAEFFQNPPKPASAHLCIDNNSIVRCVDDNHIAGGAPGANPDGIHLELAGYASQTEAKWLDDYGRQLLDNAANAAAQYCLKYDIPVRQLTNEELADGQSKGFVSHGQVSEVFKQSDHWDPGPGFPWALFLSSVEQHRVDRLARLTGTGQQLTGDAGAELADKTLLQT
jgi:N-acetyl-anhydromuramyl-L-alanine amidase AmpD